MRNWRMAITPVLLLTLLLAACGSGSDDPTDAAPAPEPAPAPAPSDDASEASGFDGELLGAGATFITPLMLEWTRDNAPGIDINYQSIGSGGGIAQFLEESVDFGSTERYLTDEEVADARDIRGCEALHIPDAFGSVVVSFNDPDLEAALEAAGQEAVILDAATIAGIFSATITSWDDPAIAALNPGVALPSTSLVAVHRSDGSGTTYIFTRYLDDEVAEWAAEFGYGSEVDWAAGTIGGNGNEGVAAEVQGQPGAVGYLSYAYAIENGIPVAAVVNADGNVVYPTIESISAGPESILDSIPEDFRYDILGVGADGYPIVGTHWILAWECGYEEARAQALRDFLSWAVTEGDDLAVDLLYSPVTGAFEQRVLDQIARINSLG